MAETTTTINQPSPILEGSLTAFLKNLDPLQAKQINTATYAPQVAAQDALQTQAAAAAQGLGSLTGTGAGPATQAGSIASYMSPYQQQVMDATMTEFDRNAAVQNVGLRDNAISMGAYGGGREGVMAAEAMRGNQMNRAQLQAQLLNQGYQQAQGARSQDLAAQQGLGTYQSQLGGQQRQIGQGQLAADQEAAREAAFADYTQLGLVAPQLASVIGGFPAATQMQSTPPPSTTQQLHGLGIGATGLAGAIGSLRG